MGRLKRVAARARRVQRRLLPDWAWWAGLVAAGYALGQLEEGLRAGHYEATIAIDLLMLFNLVIAASAAPAALALWYYSVRSRVVAPGRGTTVWMVGALAGLALVSAFGVSGRLTLAEYAGMLTAIVSLLMTVLILWVVLLANAQRITNQRTRADG